jgi:hypothetical protein
MPTYNIHGIVVGIRTTSVEIRVGNIITSWYEFNSHSIIFYLD